MIAERACDARFAGLRIARNLFNGAAQQHVTYLGVARSMDTKLIPGQQYVTSAGGSLKKLKQAHPPSYPLNSRGFDRAQALAGVLFESLPPSVRERLEDGRVVVGELGIATPDVYTAQQGLDEGERCVVMHSGQMDFYYAISRAAHGVAQVHDATGKALNEMALPMSESMRLITETLLDWKKHCQPSFGEQVHAWFGADPSKARISASGFELPEEIRNYAEKLTTSSELFMLAHEFGHVALSCGAATPLSNREEPDADLIGLGFYLPASLAQLDTRFTLAGMAFAVRVTASLQEVGAQFSHAYDPPEERLGKLLAALKARAPSEAYHDESATIMVNYLDELDYADQYRRGRPVQHEAAMNEWQGRVRMIAVLEATARGNAGYGAFEALCTNTYQDVAAPALEKIGACLIQYYVRDPNGIAFQTAEIRASMGEKLKAFIPQLPSELRRCFSA